MKLVGHVQCMGEKINEYKNLTGKVKKKKKKKAESKGF
jgi:hypothetical protein